MDAVVVVVVVVDDVDEDWTIVESIDRASVESWFVVPLAGESANARDWLEGGNSKESAVEDDSKEESL